MNFEELKLQAIAFVNKALKFMSENEGLPDWILLFMFFLQPFFLAALIPLSKFLDTKVNGGGPIKLGIQRELKQRELERSMLNQIRLNRSKQDKQPPL